MVTAIRPSHPRYIWQHPAWLAKGLLRGQGVGKATRYAVNVPGWQQPAETSNY